MSKYTIRIAGCDDNTEFEIELNDEELKVVQKISELSKLTSNYDCQPRLFVC